MLLVIMFPGLDWLLEYWKLLALLCGSNFRGQYVGAAGKRLVQLMLLIGLMGQPAGSLNFLQPLQTIVFKAGRWNAPDCRKHWQAWRKTDLLFKYCVEAAHHRRREEKKKSGDTRISNPVSEKDNKSAGFRKKNTLRPPTVLKHQVERECRALPHRFESAIE